MRRTAEKIVNDEQLKLERWSRKRDGRSRRNSKKEERENGGSGEYGNVSS